MLQKVSIDGFGYDHSYLFYSLSNDFRFNVRRSQYYCNITMLIMRLQQYGFYVKLDYTAIVIVSASCFAEAMKFVFMRFLSSALKTQRIVSNMHIQISMLACGRRLPQTTTTI